MNTSYFRKLIYTLMFFLGTTNYTFAIDSRIRVWEGEISNILDAAVVPFAIVGGFLVFMQYMLGNSDASKKLMMFCIGLAIFALAPQISAIFLP